MSIFNSVFSKSMARPQQLRLAIGRLHGCGGRRGRLRRRRSRPETHSFRLVRRRLCFPHHHRPLYCSICSGYPDSPPHLKRRHQEQPPHNSPPPHSALRLRQPPHAASGSPPWEEERVSNRSKPATATTRVPQMTRQAHADHNYVEPERLISSRSVVCSWWGGTA